uniref:Uncharacterized protein n=1 Tax=Coccidioides posadasii RMSCC 3488 TaxID=454284 RepID=A0A0J6FRV2_COCPO|nr:hypothetical protein CPAG_08444 [Coccidioides posadasii RMSCC 3488]
MCRSLSPPRGVCWTARLRNYAEIAGLNLVVVPSVPLPPPSCAGNKQSTPCGRGGIRNAGIYAQTESSPAERVRQATLDPPGRGKAFCREPEVKERPPTWLRGYRRTHKSAGEAQPVERSVARNIRYKEAQDALSDWWYFARGTCLKRAPFVPFRSMLNGNIVKADTPPASRGAFIGVQGARSAASLFPSICCGKTTRVIIARRLSSIGQTTTTLSAAVHRILWTTTSVTFFKDQKCDGATLCAFRICDFQVCGFPSDSRFPRTSKRNLKVKAEDPAATTT